MMVWKGKTPLNLWLSWGILSQISKVYEEILGYGLDHECTTSDFIHNRT